MSAVNDVQDDLKLGNWYGIVTYDIFKLAAAGAQIAVSESDDGLVITLLGVGLDDDNLNRKFRRWAVEMAQPQVEP